MSSDALSAGLFSLADWTLRHLQPPAPEPPHLTWNENTNMVNARLKQPVPAYVRQVELTLTVDGQGFPPIVTTPTAEKIPLGPADPDQAVTVTLVYLTAKNTRSDPVTVSGVVPIPPPPGDAVSIEFD